MQVGKLTVKIENFTPLRSKTQIGFADIAIPKLDLLAHGIEVHESNGKRWVRLPAEAQLGCDGRNVVLQFVGPGTANCFSQRVIAALLESFPDAFTTPKKFKELRLMAVKCARNWRNRQLIGPER